MSVVSNSIQMHPQIEKVWRLSFMSVLELIEMVFVETILGERIKRMLK